MTGIPGCRPGKIKENILKEEKAKNQRRRKAERKQTAVGHSKAGTNLQTSFSSNVSLSCRMDVCWVLTATGAVLGFPGSPFPETFPRSWGKHYKIKAWAQSEVLGSLLVLRTWTSNWRSWDDFLSYLRNFFKFQ